MFPIEAMTCPAPLVGPTPTPRISQSHRPVVKLCRLGSHWHGSDPSHFLTIQIKLDSNTASPPSCWLFVLLHVNIKQEVMSLSKPSLDSAPRHCSSGSAGAQLELCSAVCYNPADSLWRRHNAAETSVKHLSVTSERSWTEPTTRSET